MYVPVDPNFVFLFLFYISVILKTQAHKSDRIHPPEGSNAIRGVGSRTLHLKLSSINFNLTKVN